jgi:PilZ domain
MSDIDFPERRRAGRDSIERRVTLLIESDRTNTHRDAVTIDLCVFGARVHTEASLSPGQSIDLIVKEDVPHIIPAQVIWVDGMRSGSHKEAGISFTDPDHFPRALLSETMP